MAKHRKLGPAHIFALGDSLHDILAQLSPAYLERCFARLQACLADLSIRPKRLRWGWIHPGYAVLAPHGSGPDRCCPAEVFGWVSQASAHDPYRDKTRRFELADALAQTSPRLLWATCSARAFQYLNVAEDDFQAGLEFFFDAALGDPTDWAFHCVSPDGARPVEPWKGVCYAAALEDKKLQVETWRQAKSAYTPAAVRLLEQGVELTMKCTRPGQ